MAGNDQTDLQKIKELIQLMKDNDLVEIEIVDGGNKILLKRPQGSPSLGTVQTIDGSRAEPMSS